MLASTLPWREMVALNATNSYNMGKDINRIKVVLADKKRTNKWLVEQLGKDPATVSKWCTNSCQPTLETLMKIAKLLNVEPGELMRFREDPNPVK